MERVVHVCYSYEEMERWDRMQDLALTPEERMAILRELQLRMHGPNAPDVRASERAR